MVEIYSVTNANFLRSLMIIKSVNQSGRKGLAVAFCLVPERNTLEYRSADTATRLCDEYLSQYRNGHKYGD